MKKIISLILVVLCLFALFSCGNNNGEPNYDPEYTYIVSEVEEKYLIVTEIGDDGTVKEGVIYSTPNPFYPDSKIAVGDKVVIKHNGIIMESYPMQFAKIYSMEFYDKDKGVSVKVNID